MPSRRKKQDQKSKQRSSGGRRLLSALKFASPTGQKQREETAKDPKSTKHGRVAKDGAETSQALGAQVVTPESSRLSDSKLSLSQQQQQDDQWPTAFSFSFQESEASEANVISPARSRGTSVASSAAPSRHSSDLDYLMTRDQGEAKPKQSVSRSNSIASSTGAPSETSHFSDLDNLLTAVPPQQHVPQEFGIPTSKSQQSFALSAADTTTSPFPSHLKSAGGRSVASGAPSETSHVSELDNLLTMVPGPLSPPSNHLANQYDYESESPNQPFIPQELIIPSAASSRAPSHTASAVDTTASPPLPYYLQSLAGSRSNASAAPSEISHVSELDNLLTLMPEPTANLADPYGYGGTPLVPQELVIPVASRRSAAALDTSNALSVSKSRRSSNSVGSSAPSESSNVSELDNLLTSMVPDVAVSNNNNRAQRDVPMELVIPSTPSAHAPHAADTSPSFPSYIKSHAGSSVTSSLATDGVTKKYSPGRSPGRRFKSDASASVARSTSTAGGIREAVRQLELKAQEEREAAERQAKEEEESSYPFIQKDDVHALMCGIDRLHTYLEDVALNACWK